jgi:hypothetical protein
VTLIELIELESARLSQAGVSFGQGTTNAFDEAAWLVKWALGLPLDTLDEHAGRPVSRSTAITRSCKCSPSPTRLIRYTRLLRTKGVLRQPAPSNFQSKFFPSRDHSVGNPVSVLVPF